MKKVLATILIAAMLITALSACGETTPSATTAPGGASATTAAQKAPSRTDVNISINKAQNTLDPQATSNVQDRQ